jgi:hypothetical protein
MRYARRKHNRHTLLFALLLVALVGMLLPARITGKFINLVQVIAPFQDWAGRSADSAGAVVSPSDPRRRPRIGSACNARTRHCAINWPPCPATSSSWSAISQPQPAFAAWA